MIKRALLPLFYVATAVFLAVYISRLDPAVLQSLRPDLALVGVSAAMGLLYRAWGAGVWVALLRALGAPIPRPLFLPLLRAYATAWLGRYVPGKVAWIVGKIALATKLGVTAERAAISGVFENILHLATGLVVGAGITAAVGPFWELAPVWRYAVFAFVAAAVVGLHPRVFASVFNRVFKLLKREQVDLTATMSSATLVKFFGLSAVGTIWTGGSYFFLLQAMNDSVTSSSFIYCIGAFSLAGALGTLAIFAPGGFGVREGVQALLLAPLLSGEQLVVFVAVGRLWSLVLDLAFFAIAWILGRRGTLATMSTTTSDGDVEGDATSEARSAAAADAPRESPRDEG